MMYRSFCSNAGESGLTTRHLAWIVSNGFRRRLPRPSSLAAGFHRLSSLFKNPDPLPKVASGASEKERKKTSNGRREAKVELLMMFIIAECHCYLLKKLMIICYQFDGLLLFVRVDYGEPIMCLFHYILR